MAREKGDSVHLLDDEDTVTKWEECPNPEVEITGMFALIATCVASAYYVV